MHRPPLSWSTWAMKCARRSALSLMPYLDSTSSAWANASRQRSRALGASCCNCSGVSRIIGNPPLDWMAVILPRLQVERHVRDVAGHVEHGRLHVSIAARADHDPHLPRGHALEGEAAVTLHIHVLRVGAGEERHARGL